MKKQKEYEIYTDASVNNITKIATYSIIISSENKILRTVAKKSYIPIENPTEIEILAIFQAINILFNCYFNKNEKQKFSIKTDCISARDFYLQNKKMRIFKKDNTIQNKMKNTYKDFYADLSKAGSELKIKWVPRNSNKIAHKYAYGMLKSAEILNRDNDDITINVNTLCEMLSEFSKDQKMIFQHLLSLTDTEDFIRTTQSSIASSLKISNSSVSKTIRKLSEFNIIQKIGRGKYLLQK